MREALLGTMFASAFILAAVLWFRGIHAMFKAAANRKPGVGYFTAINGVSLIFRDSLYTYEGLQWATTYGRCMLGFIVILVIELVIAKVTGYP